MLVFLIIIPEFHYNLRRQQLTHPTADFPHHQLKNRRCQLSIRGRHLGIDQLIVESLVRGGNGRRELRTSARRAVGA